MFGQAIFKSSEKQETGKLGRNLQKQTQANGIKGDGTAVHAKMFVFKHIPVLLLMLVFVSTYVSP